MFSKYGEATEAKKVAKAICKYRDNKTIDTTSELVNIIKDAVAHKNIILAIPVMLPKIS